MIATKNSLKLFQQTNFLRLLKTQNNCNKELQLDTKLPYLIITIPTINNLHINKIIIVKGNTLAISLVENHLLNKKENHHLPNQNLKRRFTEQTFIKLAINLVN